jgi:hypothetical protein
MLFLNTCWSRSKATGSCAAVRMIDRSTVAVTGSVHAVSKFRTSAAPRRRSGVRTTAAISSR